MTTINRFAYNGFTAGACSANGGSDDFSILATIGIGGMGKPTPRTTLTDRQGDGQVAGSSYAGSREISGSIWTPDLDVVEAMEAAMAARPDPDDELPWSYRIASKAERRLYVRPERFDYLWDEQGIGANLWRCDCLWIASDPTKYSEAQTTHVFGTGSATGGLGTSPAGSFSVTVVNDGTRGVSSGRALELTITAHGTVVYPYIKVTGDAERVDEQVTWYRTMSNGQVLSTDERLTARVGSQLVSAVARSSSSSPFLRWPRAEPGSQTIEVGCQSGTISGSLKIRDTW